MVSAIQIPVSEYLETTYHPDREYIDGELQERNVGKWSHARVQWLLALWFGRHESLWNVIGSAEQRMQVSPMRIRIPDLVVLRPGTQTDVLSTPPLLVIEILSPEDSYSSLQERCQDFLAMGIEAIWIIDPSTQSGRMCSQTEWLSAARLTVPGTPIYVELDQLFSQLDTPSRDSA
jgi:Uma2 family endonuclease